MKAKGSQVIVKEVIKVIVIDDHPLVRKGIEMVVDTEEDINIVGSAGNGAEALQALRENGPHIALVDLRLSDEHGIDIIIKAKEQGLQCKYIVLTSYASEEEIRRAMENEVDGYILKEALPEELVSAVRLVYRGRKYYDPAVVQYALEQGSSKKKQELEDLTPREREVLAALAKGMSNREIAGALIISEHTVKKHIGQILEKLHLHDRTQAALYAVSQELNKQ